MFNDTKPFLKIIAGINNTNLENINKVLNSSIYCGVECIDICDDAHIIDNVKRQILNKKSNIKLFVSSIRWQNLVQAHELGADYLEIGNYDNLYDDGINFSVQEIIDCVANLNDRGLNNLSVTIPSYLNTNEQTSLALNLLNNFSIKILQTEGRTLSSANSAGAIGHIEKAKVTLANTLELRMACLDACIMTAGGLSAITAPLALAAGANGLGVGNCVSKLSSEIEMIAQIKSIQERMNSFEHRLLNEKV